MTGSISQGLRRFLAARGYSLTKTRYQRYGIDPFIDVQRLASHAGVQIKRCFDVGANVGQTANEMRRTFSDARIDCFEPVPSTFEQLAANIATLTNIHAHNVALSDSDGDAVIHTFADSSLVSSLESEAIFTHGRDFEVCQQNCSKMRLDQFVSQHSVDRIDLLKIDTEGHDIAVLHGAADMLAAGRVGFILTEFNALFPISDKRAGTLVETGEFLRQFGYAFVSSYIDDIHLGTDSFVVGNALFIKMGNSGTHA